MVEMTDLYVTMYEIQCEAEASVQLRHLHRGPIHKVMLPERLEWICECTTGTKD